MLKCKMQFVLHREDVWKATPFGRMFGHTVEDEEQTGLVLTIWRPEDGEGAASDIFMTGAVCEIVAREWGKAVVHIDKFFEQEDELLENESRGESMELAHLKALVGALPESLALPELTKARGHLERLGIDRNRKAGGPKPAGGGA